MSILLPVNVYKVPLDEWQTVYTLIRHFALRRLYCLLRPVCPNFWLNDGISMLSLVLVPIYWFVANTICGYVNSRNQRREHYLEHLKLSMLGKISSKRHIENFLLLFPENRICQFKLQYNLNGSNTDGSFTVDDSNSFFSPYKILPIAQENKHLGIIFLFYHGIVCCVY